MPPLLWSMLRRVKGGYWMGCMRVFIRHIAMVCLSVVFAAQAFAQADKPLSFIRDTEIENYLRDLGRPIMQAAGLPLSNVSFVLVNDNNLNAFVAGGMNIYFNTGLLLQAANPDQLIGVLAHETGHIAGGHLVRGRAAMEKASAQALLATLLGVAAGVAGGDPQAGQAIIGGGQGLAQRSFLAFSREQESAADAAGMSFLDSAKLSSGGMLAFMEKLEDQELLPTDRQVEFVRTHPLTQDRVNNIRNHVAESPFSANQVPSRWVEQHRRMQAKLLGFTDPLQALSDYKATDAGFAARYARAIAQFKRNQLVPALAAVDGLLAEEPENPYLYELKGQMLFENGRGSEALPYYKKSVALLPDAPLLRTGYAHALLESKDATQIQNAITQLHESLRYEERAPFTWRLLATAYGRQGDEGASAYALAEEAMARGDAKAAAPLIQRAERLLPQGSPFRLKLLDLKASVAEAEKNKE